MKYLLFIFLWCLLPECAFSQVMHLDDFINAGLKNNFQKQQFQNSHDQLKYDSALYRSSLRPIVGIEGRLMYAPSINGYGYDKDIINPSEYILVGGITQELLAGKLNKANYAKLRAQGQSLEALRHLNEKELTKTITEQYITASMLGKQLTIIKSIVHITEQFQDVLKSLTQQGIFKATDYLAFTIEAESQKISLDNAAMEYKIALDSLNIICGIADTNSNINLDIPAQLYINNTESKFPLTQKFLADSILLASERNLVSTKYQPRLNWFANAGINAVESRNIYKNAGTSFGLNFIYPIYDGGQKSIQLKKLGLEESNRKFALDYYRRLHQNKISQLQNQLALNKSISNRYMEQQHLSKTLLDLNIKLLSSGEITITELINSLRTDREIQMLMLENEKQRLLVENNLNFLKN